MSRVVVNTVDTTVRVRVDNVTEKVTAKIYQGRKGTNGTNGGSTSAWNYKAKTNATSGYPGNGYLLWNNATQTSATSILVSHLNDDDTDLELLLSFFTVGQKLFIQDRDESANNQVWEISGTPTLTGAGTTTAYFTFPVTLVSSAGAAFTNNQQIVFGSISVATNAVTSATTSDGTATLSLSTLTVGSAATFNNTTWTYGTGAASAHKTALAIASADITDATSAATASKIAKRSASGGLSVTNLAASGWIGVGQYIELSNGSSGIHNIYSASTDIHNAIIPNKAGTFAFVDDIPAALTLGTGVQAALALNVGSAGAFITFNGALGTPSSGTLTSCTGLPISTGVSGLGTNVATFLQNPSSANLAAAVTDETGTGSLVFADNPTLGNLTLNGTTYTYGSGGALAHRAGLGFYSIFLASNLQSSSTSYVNSSESVTLPAGTYEITIQNYCTTNSTTAGIATRLTSATATSSPSWGYMGSNSLNSLNAAGNMGGFTYTQMTSATNIFPNSRAANINRGTIFQQGSAILTFASAATITYSVAQVTATDASNPAILLAGSYVVFRRIS